MAAIPRLSLWISRWLEGKNGDTSMRGFPLSLNRGLLLVWLTLGLHRLAVREDRNHAKEVHG